MGPSEIYAEPLSFIFPRDGLKGFEKARYSPGLLAQKGLTDKERDRLQDEIDELIAAAKLGAES